MDKTIRDTYKMILRANNTLSNKRVKRLISFLNGMGGLRFGYETRVLDFLRKYEND